jgi:hypothetical protein
MPVKVICPKPSAGNASATSTEQHSKAEGIVVRDGHLHVLLESNQASEVIAVYAPGRWFSASTEG